MQAPSTLFSRQRSLRIARKVIAVACLLFFFSSLPWSSGAAHAHATLLASAPASGEVVLDSPDTLRLTFNEDVTLLETTRLTGPGGVVVYTAKVADGLVELIPETPLIDGRWSIVWQIVSADGHLVGGVVPFTVGSKSTSIGVLGTKDDGGAYIGETAVDTPGVLDRILELFGWLALIFALGALIAGRARLSAGYAAAAVLIPMLRVVDAFDRWGSSAWIIGETRAGLVAALAGGFLLVSAFRAGRSQTALMVFVVLVWAAQAFLSGHPNVVDPKPLYASLSALHLAGALTWSAAVTAVFLNSNSAKRASRVATIGIVLLLPGAVLLSAAFVPAAFVNGAGRWEGILALKAALVFGALLLGWRNHRDVRRDDLEKRIPPNLRRRVRIEFALIVLVAFLSATLTTSVPARVVHAGMKDAASAVSPDVSGAGDPSIKEDLDAIDARMQVNSELVFENGETGDLLLEIDADGSTVIHLVLRDPDGNLFTGEQVEYEIDNLELDIIGITGNLLVNGSMHMGETVLPGQGTWRMSVYVTYDTFTTISATVEIIVEKTGQ